MRNKHRNNKITEINYVWTTTIQEQSQYNIDQPKLPRIRSAPAKLEKPKMALPKDTEAYFKDLASGMIDNVVVCFDLRFHNSSSLIYKAIESFMLNKDTVSRDISGYGF